jgi:hypothetical protein
MPFTLSPSSLSLFSECPRCFWLHYKKKIRRPDWPFPSLPSGMDRIIKKHFDNFMEKDKLPPELFSLKGVKLFKDKKLLEIWRNNRKGIRWMDRKGNTLRGAMDCVLLKRKNLIVLDFKTRGFPLKEDSASYYFNQLAIYNLLLNKNGYATENYAYLLFYHPDRVKPNGNVVFNADLVKMPVSPGKAETLFKKALKTLNSKQPKPARDCGLCKWAKEYV